MLRKELVNILTSYLSNWDTLHDLYYWISGVSSDDPALASDRDLDETMGLLELLSTEVIEGLRPEIELIEAASAFVAAEMSRSYVFWNLPTIRVSARSNNLMPIVPPFVIGSPVEFGSANKSLQQVSA